MIRSSPLVMFQGFLIINYAENIITYERSAMVSELTGFCLGVSLIV
jgi:hypothetical protein